MTFCIYDSEIKTIKKMVRRNVYHNLKMMDRSLDKMSDKFCRTFKGIGDAIGIVMAAAGGITFIIGIGCADSIATEKLNTWAFCMICSFLATIGGVKLLAWMRS